MDMASSMKGGFRLPGGLENSIYGFSAARLDGRLESLSDYRGRVLLIVNTASRCGFTPQYAGLEQLNRTYKARGLEVLGFPCNQFGRQEPGSAEEIGAFCERNYGVSFPLFAKIDVNGTGAHPLYRWLKRSKPGVLGLLDAGRVWWNFTKFLVDREGKVVARFGSSRAPQSLAEPIEALLG
jgi:glutathione peroxidase